MLGLDDENAGRAALAQWLPKLLDAARADGPNLDSEGGAERAMQLVAVAESEAVKARLALVPEALFAGARVSELETLALALRQIDRVGRVGKVEGAPAKSVAASVPVVGASDAQNEEAEQVRTALFKLLDYHFGEDPIVAAELGEGKPKAGGFRFALMLARLAGLADARSETLSRDLKYWRPSLIADARRLAEAGLANVETLTEREALDVKRRAFGLLEATFNDVRQAIAFVMRADAMFVDGLPFLVVKKPITRKVKGEPTAVTAVAQAAATQAAGPEVTAAQAAIS